MIIWALRKLGRLCVDFHKLTVWNYTHGFICFTFLQINSNANDNVVYKKHTSDSGLGRSSAPLTRGDVSICSVQTNVGPVNKLMCGINTQYQQQRRQSTHLTDTKISTKVTNWYLVDITRWENSICTEAIIWVNTIQSCLRIQVRAWWYTDLNDIKEQICFQMPVPEQYQKNDNPHYIYPEWYI